jgi:hypothetical protein
MAALNTRRGVLFCPIVKTVCNKKNGIAAGVELRFPKTRKAIVFMTDWEYGALDRRVKADI